MARVDALRILYQRSFPHVPLVPRDEILKPKEITAAGAQGVLTFKQYVAQRRSEAAERRRERGLTN
jgi:hypothetical protein